MEAYLARFLADPQTILEASIDLQLAIASYIDTPERLLEILVNSPDRDVASAARLHVNWAGEIEGDAERAIDELFKAQQLGQNDRLAVELLKLGTVPPCFVSQWVPPNKIVERLDNPHMPLEYKIQFLERLAREDRLDIVVPVAGSIDTPPPLLAQLIGSVHLAIRDTARNNPSSLPETIESIDREYEIAANWDTPPAQLAISATSHWEWIRLTVAQNPSTSAETLMALAQDEIDRIRLAVANNPHASAAVLQVLAENNHGEMRSLVAKHPQTSEETLHQLFTDCQNVLRGRTDLPLSILERFFEERDKTIPLWKEYLVTKILLANVNTSSEILNQLSTDYIEEIEHSYETRLFQQCLGEWILDSTDYLCRVVKHQNTDAITLTRLANHYNPNVRLVVGLNQRTPEEIRFNILESLGCHPIKMDFRRSVICDIDIKKVIARNLNTPISILSTMAENELIDNKVKIETRKTLEIYCPEDSDWFDTSNDTIISKLKDEILNPAGIVVDSERWVELIPDDNFSFQQSEAQWQELLPQLSSESVKAVIGNILTISNNIREFLPRDPFWNTVVSLLGNPHTPEILREKLWKQYQRHPDITRYPERDFPLRFALATNPSVPEARRREYFRQIGDRPGLTESIAKAPNIPQDLLLELADINAGIRQAIAQNPNVPHSLLLELSKNSNSTTRNYVAKNPNTPLDILLTLTNDGALNNPIFPPLEIYRVTLEKNLSYERQQTSELIASLPLTTKLSLTQVVEGNELSAKLAIAQDLQTPIDILERLAQDSNENVRSALASNRNLPLATLLKLADDTSSNIRMNIARNSNTPPEILAQLAFADDPGGWIADSLVKNQNTSVETLEYLGVERHVVNAYNKNTPSTALAAQVDYALTQHSKTKVNIFELLHGDLERSQMPASSLIKLATNSEELIRARVALHRNTPHVVLEQLSNDKSYSPILWNIAINPNSSPALLAKLLKENYETVAGHMAERRIIPLSIMGRLLEHESERVRTQIVYRDNLSLDLARQIIQSETHNSVLLSLAYNRVLTSDLIFNLLQHPSLNSDICIALLVHPSLTIEHWQQLASSQFEAVRLAITSCQNTPIDILAILADDREIQIRMAIASNLQTPSDILIKLATDPEVEVRTKIAANPQTPIPILETLAADTSVEVRRSVLNNPQTPVSTRQDLEDIFGRKPIATTIDTLRDLPRIYDPANDDLITILTEYAGSNNAFVRLVSLLHPLMPVEVIERAVRSPYWSDRYAVAKNPTTPDRLRQNLGRDSNRIVRAIASMMTS